MILTRREILKEMRNGNIKIKPFSLSQLGPASVDLHLDNIFRRFMEIKGSYIVNEKADYGKITKTSKAGRIILKPQETIHGITKEKITLAKNICGWLEGRSRFARLGLLIHISAGFVQPGVNNRQVLEISNMSPIPLEIKPGLKVCQIIFQRCEGEAGYKGRFRNQKAP